MSIQISAVICTLNRAAYLEKAISSLVNQTLHCDLYEIIVVDSGSNDNTKVIIESFEHLGTFRFISEPIKGLSQARNTGWQNAHGKYIAFLDDDAIACPEWLSRIVKAFETVQPQPGSVGGKVIPIWEAKRPDWLSKQLELPLTIVDWVDKPTFLTEDYQDLRGTNVAYPRELLQRFGGFNTSLGRKGGTLLSNDEKLLNRCLKRHNLQRYYNPEICVQHHVPAERLVKQWFYKRYYWQGVSDEILQYIETYQSGIKPHYLYRGVVNASCFFVNLRNLHTILIPANTRDQIERKCNSYNQLGHIWTQLRIGLGVVRR